MTIKEALEILYKGIAPNPTANNECIKLCKATLEKQIPKKVNSKKVDDTFGITGGKCPVCGYARLYDNHKFCHKCGQALDWGDSSADTD